MIRVEIASTSGLRNIRNETIKTTSQVRDFSIEDGGIFEKKGSIEEAKNANSLTQRSYELLQQTKSHSEMQELLDYNSQQEAVRDSRGLAEKMDLESVKNSGVVNVTQTSALRGAETHAHDGTEGRRSDLLDHEETS